MFLLRTITDTLHLPAPTFAQRTRAVLESTINALYANRVIHSVGLVICFYDLLSAGDGLIADTASDGGVYVNARFRLLTFRPFRGEILEGRVSHSTEAGVHITLDFFDEVLIPPTHLFPDCALKPAGQGERQAVWIWRHETEEEDGAPASVREYFFDANLRVRWRVEEEVWTDLGPKGPVLEDAGVELGREGKKVPWRLVGSMSQAWLGAIDWW